MSCGRLSVTRAVAGYSPDRVDALVWALTELFEPRAGDGAYEYYRRKAQETETK